MSTRDFSIVRRRRNLIDMLTPKRAGVKGYRFDVATNFDAAFTTILTADISSGYLDPAINRAVLNSMNNDRDFIRIVFDPDTFAGATGISDNSHFWLRFVPIDWSGVAGTAGPMGLVITEDERSAQGHVQINGTAPQGAAIANSLQLDLPYSMSDFIIRNNEASGGRTLFVSFLATGGEQQVAPQEQMKVFDGQESSLFVRGSGGTVSFSASFTNYLPL